LAKSSESNWGNIVTRNQYGRFRASPKVGLSDNPDGQPNDRR
jgi:hypothetical protein